MTMHIFEPHDSVIARDSRPFSSDPGARASTMPFPTPSMIAGLARTQSLQSTHAPDERGKYTEDQIRTVLGIGIQGPLLVQLHEENDTIAHWYAPAPKDAVLIKKDIGSAADNLHRLIPNDLPKGSITDLTPNANGLQLLKMQNPDLSKVDEMPAFWNWTLFEQWLMEKPNSQDFENRTIKKLPVTTRTHLQVDRMTNTNQDGMLFETNGLEFTVVEHTADIDVSKRYKRLALAFASTSDNFTEKRIATLGGEARLGTLSTEISHFPLCPHDIRESIAKTGRCRVFLLTPAFFTQGYLPTWICQTRDGITAKLHAIAIDRPQVLSGWDINKGLPKPTVRMAPAGTVLFLELNGTPEQRRKWIDNMWMRTISDDAIPPYLNNLAHVPADQFRLDGFGLAALGAWSTDIQSTKGVQ